MLLSWEFPPRIVGDIAVYVDRLASTLTNNGIDVYVVTFHENRTGLERRIDGVKVYRVASQVKTHTNVLTWDLSLMVEFIRAFSDIYYSVGGKVNLIDAHEWLCVPAATALRKAFNIPFTFTVHSLEDHRSSNANEPLNASIKHLEGLGIRDSDRILVESEWMSSEVTRIHGNPLGKIDVIHTTSPKWTEDVNRIYTAIVDSLEDGSHNRG